MHIPRQQSSTTILCLPPGCRILNNHSTATIKGIIKSEDIISKTTKQLQHPRHHLSGHVMKMAQVSTNSSTVAPSAGPFRCTRRKQANPRRKNGKCPFCFLCLALNFVVFNCNMYSGCHLQTHRRLLSFLLVMNHIQSESSTSCILTFPSFYFLSVTLWPHR